MFGRLSLGGLIHFEIMDGREREATFSEEEPDSKGSARVDFGNFFAESLLIKPPLDKEGYSCFVSRVGVMRVEDLVGFDKSLSGGGPLLTLSMGFLDSNDVIVVQKLVEGFFLTFLRASGMPSAVRRPLAFLVANERVGDSHGRMRLASASLWGLDGRGQVGGLGLGVAGV